MRSLRAVPLLLALALVPPARAEPGQLLNVSVGIGESGTSSANVPGSGTGAYALVEYAPWRDLWFTPKPYAGVLYTRPASDCGAGVTPCDVSARIVFLGGAIRLMAPLPYVGPFIELGFGASVGQLTTRSGTAFDVRSSGVTYHVPYAFGVAFGSRHEYELALRFMEHPEQHQTNGALAIGFGFRLD